MCRRCKMVLDLAVTSSLIQLFCICSYHVHILQCSSECIAICLKCVLYCLNFSSSFMNVSNSNFHTKQCGGRHNLARIRYCLVLVKPILWLLSGAQHTHNTVSNCETVIPNCSQWGNNWYEFQPVLFSARHFRYTLNCSVLVSVWNYMGRISNVLVILWN